MLHSILFEFAKAVLYVTLKLLQVFCFPALLGGSPCIVQQELGLVPSFKNAA
jgi:hypothetical protein